MDPVLAVFLVTAQIAYGVLYAVCKAELDAEIARIRARGEPLTLTEFAADEEERTPEDRKVLEALASIDGYSLSVNVAAVRIQGDRFGMRLALS